MSNADEELAIDLDDIRSDADLWCQAAGVLEQAVGLGRDQDPPNSAFMVGGILVAEAYRDLAPQLLSRLIDGVEQFQSLCRALRDVADDYENNEVEAVAVIASMDERLEAVDA